MYNFFIKNENMTTTSAVIDGKDFNHIKNVLRMAVGETLLISVDGFSHLSEIEEFTDNAVKVKIIERDFSNTTLPVKIHLYQGLPKSDKMELIVQKAVELGVTEITPVEMVRSIVKLDDKKKKEKTTRWQAVSESAAKQSKRTEIPTVNPPIPFKLALQNAKDSFILLPYENKDGAESLKRALESISAGQTVSVFIGPEGGFDDKEIDFAKENGAVIVSLGKRILRTETAAMLAVGAVMLYSEINL